MDDELITKAIFCIVGICGIAWFIDKIFRTKLRQKIEKKVGLYRENGENEKH